MRRRLSKWRTKYGGFGFFLSYSQQWFRRWPPNARSGSRLWGRPRNSGGPSGEYEIVEQALIHAVALVHESLVVAVYPEKAYSGKLKIDDGVEDHSQCCGAEFMPTGPETVETSLAAPVQNYAAGLVSVCFTRLVLGSQDPTRMLPRRSSRRK